MAQPGGSMYQYYRRRIGAAGVDFEGVYEFYKKLERRERTESIWKLAMALSVPVMLIMSTWCGAHYVNWTPVARTLQQFL